MSIYIEKTAIILFSHCLIPRGTLYILLYTLRTFRNIFIISNLVKKDYLM